MIWACPKCKDVKISNSHRTHTMDTCKCKESSVDFEEDYTRCIGFPMILGRIYYNFFDELVLGMVEQGFINYVNIGDGKIYLNFVDVYMVREFEDKILKELAWEEKKNIF